MNKDVNEIIIAGFGGQGVLSTGQILAYAAMKENKEVSWMPSYGPEMRGGTANCIVIISNKRISSPIITTFNHAIILNQPSLEKFESAIKPNGVIVFEKSTIINPPARKDVVSLSIDGLKEAKDFGVIQIANMVLMGAFLAKTNIVKIENMINVLKEVLPPHRQHLVPLNQKALLRGKELAFL